MGQGREGLLVKKAPPILYVMGPSGAGKDSLMEAALRADRRLVLMDRYVTREGKNGSRDISIGKEEFSRLKGEGAFLFDWESHGFSYGIKRMEEEDVKDGLDGDNLKDGMNEDDKILLVNGSRNYLPQALEIVPDLRVLSVEAPLELLRTRLLLRGRESPFEIEERLRPFREKTRVPESLRLWVINNSGTLEKALGEFLRILSEL
jgi:ribose 1,5-bisphosphokinase